MRGLLLIGLNHETAPLEVREKLAFGAQQQRDALAAYRERFGASEAVLLSTCNRVELYTAGGAAERDQIVAFLGAFHNVPTEMFAGHLYVKSERAVAEHLFSVVASLNSMVLGETQILGQVREAYEVARVAGVTGAMLNPLFQRAVAVGKQVMHETALAEGRLSVASVAVDYAHRIFDHFGDKTVLSIGAGKMAGLVLQRFAALKPKALLVCNRDMGKAAALAERFAGRAVAFESLDEQLVAADIVVSSTGSTQPILTKGHFESLRKRRRNRPLFVIDIAVPRDVEASVGEVENVYLYNLDDLQQVVLKTQTKRSDAVEAAKGIVEQQVKEFVMWSRQREMGPVIDRLSQRYHELAREELGRTLTKLPNVGEAEKAHLEELTRRIVNKLLHDPISTLRNAEGHHGPTAQYLHALEKLFQLNDEAGKDDESA